MSNGVTVTIDRLPAVLRATRNLAATRVLVGVPEATAGRLEHAQGALGVGSAEQAGADEITNAALAYIHEHGAPEVNVPPRPFLVPGVREALPKVERFLRDAARAALDGDAAGVDRNLNRAGLLAQAEVRRKITEGPFEPLKPGTLRARRARGRTGTRPLIDTGRLRQSITYAIERRGHRDTHPVEGGGRYSGLTPGAR